MSQCTQGYAIRLQQSKFITLRGLTITGAGGEAIALMGGNNQNTAIHLERNRIFGNGSGSCNGGITIARGNPGTLIVNNLIYGNGRNGITFIDADGGPHQLIENTIHGNAWSGVNVPREHQVLLANNAITSNGTASGSTGGRFGVTRESSSSPNLAGIQLQHNLICGNRLGEINGPALDATDSGNLTPSGTEGSGVAASPGCDNAATVYANVNGADTLANTVDDTFAPATASPLIDQGLDPRTLGLPAPFNALLEADYLAEGVRPRAGTGGQPAQFDIGALELGPPDTQAPTVTFLQPPANAHVRQTVTVQAQATDSTNVATLTLQAESQSLTTTLVPTPPATSVTGTASWTTTSVSDGTHTLTATATEPISVYCRLWVVHSLAELGRFAEAAPCEAELLRLAGPTQHAFTVGVAYEAASWLHLGKGDWATARSVIEHGIVALRKGSIHAGLRTMVAASAWVLAQVGEASEALTRLREGVQLLESQAAWHGVLMPYQSLGRAALLLDRLDEAQRLGERAITYSPFRHSDEAHALHLLGDIAVHPDRFDAEGGETHYRKALALAEPRGMRPLVAHCHLGLGRLYARTGKREAQAHLTIAMTMYREMAMQFWLEQAETEMKELA